MRVRLIAAALLGIVLAVQCGEPDSPPPPEPLTLDELVDACIRTASCGVKTQPRLSNCVDYYRTLLVNLGLRPIYDRIFRCVNQAGGDCEQVYACFGSHPMAGRCDSGFAAYCDDNQAVTCDLLDRRVYIYNCSDAGLTCRVNQGSGSFEASCTIGSCTVGAFQRRCDGSRVQTCYQGVIVVEDCAVQGLTCGTVDGQARCVGTQSTSCQPSTHKPRCLGSTAVLCQGGKVHRLDCSTQLINRACRDGQCVPSGSACQDEFNRCKGDQLQGCLDGRWTTHDCRALGLGPCKPATVGALCGPAPID